MAGTPGAGDAAHPAATARWVTGSRCIPTRIAGSTEGHRHQGKGEYFTRGVRLGSVSATGHLPIILPNRSAHAALKHQTN